VYLGSLDSDDSSLLQQSQAQALFVAGYLLYSSASASKTLANDKSMLMARPFNVSQLTFSGNAISIADAVGINSGLGLASFSASDAVLSYKVNSGVTELIWSDRSGNTLSHLGKRGSYHNPALSPDERKIAVSRDGDTWIIDAYTGSEMRFTFGPSYEDYANWSAAGDRIVFASDRAGHLDIYEKAAAGGEDQLIFSTPRDKYPEALTPDGRFLMYKEGRDRNGNDIFALPLQGEKKPIALQEGPFNDGGCHFSPDGRWFSYQSNEFGSYQIAVQPFPPTGAKWQISMNGGDCGIWSKDGRELFFIDLASTFWAAAVQSGTSFKADVPRRLFTKPVNTWGFERNTFVPAADGQRFLINAVAESELAAPISVVLNWTALLKK
jgi:Tol biopolymer transport system component